MTSGMPELGSKISLISKADIRYEGRLFTVDPQECTIALSNVRSFGTEDRESQFPVAPQNQVYEYILFRGSDIKDIRVVNNVPSVPNDPAIVQMTVHQTINNPGYQPTPGYGQPMMPQGPMGPMGPMGGQYGGPYGMPMNVPGMNPTMGMPPRDPRYVNKPPSELSVVPGEPNNTNIPNTLPMANVKPLTKAVDQVMEDGVLEMLAVAGASGGAGGTGSRAGTPMLPGTARKSPTMELIPQNNQQQQQPQQQQNARGGKAGEKSTGRRTPVGDTYRDKRDGQRGRSGSALSQYSDTKRDHHVNQDHQLDNQGHRGGNMHNSSMGQRGNSRSANWITRGNNNLIQRGRGRGRGNVFRTNQPGNNGTKPKNTLKFENDYDFEQANTEFEELRSRLAKTKIDAGTENEKKDDSGNETGAGEGEPEEDADVIHYDKSKSFFDNISCEAVERSKGSQRTDWRTERKLNSETFGVSSTRRGGFRGRGGYYNRGMSMYRGNNQGNHHQGQQMGNNGGYRGGNYRGGNRGGNNGGGGNNMNRSKPSMHHGQNNSGQNRNGNEQNVSQQQNRRLITGTV